MDPVNPVTIDKVEQIRAVDGIADGDSINRDLLDPKETCGFFPIGRNSVFANAEFASPDDVRPNLSVC